ncbi:helix-turn-helix transcriptional regulator [Burkholderia stabilis]|uniref:helix-turn-helix transcriptional regulator n=1 Tax=Burkholderia stabilis TaxID=95485 RepID=UPI00158F3940|nr:hypothetical protein [Burkholderia stabilis]HDR9496358.1 hypothetical protein [Burkholderia stabilis]HDR9528059.1 hypothetical protein [Burkholderia stabilis]HDR9535134.1 hypothetical protein [Burkholderia stabilis]HDR9542923.1 hypothetical protein [Burkholderia stabilis]HDR9550146.1 hypothetical protein [Burkholderia stabilis]
MSEKNGQMRDFRVKFNVMAESALITPAEFAALMGLSRSSFYQRRYKGDLPDPVIAENRCLRWRVRDVRAWLGALYAAEPIVRRGRPRNSTFGAVSGAQ